jgi:hypothetical protein
MDRRGANGRFTNRNGNLVTGSVHGVGRASLLRNNAFASAAGGAAMVDGSGGTVARSS